MLNPPSSIGCSCNLAERVDQDRVYYPNMLKRFSEWFGLKKKLHERQQTPPLVSEREIWWASIGENVGSEINGKSALFSRPVIIYKKLSHGFYFVIPTTTQKKEGSSFGPPSATGCKKYHRASLRCKVMKRLPWRSMAAKPATQVNRRPVQPKAQPDRNSCGGSLLKT